MTSYDVIVIGAGMSGLAAGVRLSMFGKKVAVLEAHSVPGGLNSYYKRGPHELDVGLHAMTNFAKKGESGPLSKLLKQLRVPYEKLQFSPQTTSSICYPEHSLKFSNGPELLAQEIAREFSAQKENFARLVDFVQNFDELNLFQGNRLARQEVSKLITDQALVDRLFFPLLIYGSAWEHDMDLAQFVTMFKAIYLQGFMRPLGGVRPVIQLLVDKLKENHGELRFKAQVARILHSEGQTQGVELKSGEHLLAPIVLSSAGGPNTFALAGLETQKPRPGQMGFTESVLLFDQKPKHDTIVFWNARENYHYCRPPELFDPQSAVVCFPNCFERDDLPTGMIRVTMLANYDLWAALARPEYLEAKRHVLQSSLEIAKACVPDFQGKLIMSDVFTPTTVRRYTAHPAGAVYGSPDKSRDGRTPLKGLYLMGTDQGFLGIVGAILSGITIANLHVLSAEGA